jgi:hypothetical protein
MNDHHPSLDDAGVERGKGRRHSSWEVFPVYLPPVRHAEYPWKEIKYYFFKRGLFLKIILISKAN